MLMSKVHVLLKLSVLQEIKCQRNYHLKKAIKFLTKTDVIKVAANKMFCKTGNFLSYEYIIVISPILTFLTKNYDYVFSNLLKANSDIPEWHGKSFTCCF